MIGELVYLVATSFVKGEIIGEFGVEIELLIGLLHVDLEIVGRGRRCI